MKLASYWSAESAVAQGRLAGQVSDGLDDDRRESSVGQGVRNVSISLSLRPEKKSAAVGV